MMKAEAILANVAKRWKPPKQLSVSQWADQNFVLSPEYAAEAGKWETLSFQRGPLDTISDPFVWQTVIKSCTQLLKTTCIQIGTAYVIDQDPGPILIVQPRDGDAKAFSKERIAPMLRDVPCLQGKVSDSKSRKSSNTIEEKWFRGGLLACTAAGSPGNLARRAIRFLFCDEEDKWVASSGSEGKPFSLALKRTATFRHRRKAIRCCSPTRAGSSIDRAYEESDKREFYVPCPACGHEQSMMLKFRTQVRWSHDPALAKEQRAATARYHCESCDVGWDDAARHGAVELGQWKAHAPFCGIAGFWISELYSPWKKLSEIVLDWLSAQGDQEAMISFVNTSLAENWYEPGETLEWERLVERREDYSVGVVPAGGLFLNIGADVQRADGGRIEAELLATGENGETWSVEFRKFYGDPSLPNVWAEFERWIKQTWPHELGGELSAERVFVDSGDGTTTAAVYDWVSKQPRPQVWAIKGFQHYKQPVGDPASVGGIVDQGGRKRDFGAIRRNIDTTFFKAALYADLKKRRPTDDERKKGLGFPQGFCHFPKGDVYGDEYFKQLCSEQLVTRKKKTGRTTTEYRPTGGRQEALDCRIYAMAAGWDFGARSFQPAHWQMLKARVQRKRNDATKNEAAVEPRRVVRSRYLS